MKTKNKITPSQEEFIRENRLKMSMVDMSEATGVSYHRIRLFLIDNNLKLNTIEVQKLRNIKRYAAAQSVTEMASKITEYKRRAIKRKEGYQPPKWVADPWNHGLNSHTMTVLK